jgi:GNAT superfamily N-acetyltransferase
MVGVWVVDNTETVIMNISIKEDKCLGQDQVLGLYTLNLWSSAGKPKELMSALSNSHSVVTAWDGVKLVGLGNAISDGYLVVYYPHLLVHPDYQGRGIGKMIIDRLKTKYEGFHQQILVADGKAIAFYEKCGFERAGETVPMWIYAGIDH